MIKRECGQGRGWRFSPQGKILPDLDSITEPRHYPERGARQRLAPSATRRVMGQGTGPLWVGRAKPYPLGEPRLLMRSVKSHKGLLLTKVTKPIIL